MGQVPTGSRCRGSLQPCNIITPEVHCPFSCTTIIAFISALLGSWQGSSVQAHSHGALRIDTKQTEHQRGCPVFRTKDWDRRSGPVWEMSGPVTSLQSLGSACLPVRGVGQSSLGGLPTPRPHSSTGFESVQKGTLPVFLTHSGCAWEGRTQTHVARVSLKRKPKDEV